MQELIKLQEIDLDENATEAEWTAFCGNQMTNRCN
jgi:hypothetical protein